MKTWWLMGGAVWLAAGGTIAAAELAGCLPQQPCGIGRPAADRAWWGPWERVPEAAIAIKQAETWLKAPMPAFDAERYLDYTRNGDRVRYEAQFRGRWDRFKHLVLGECLEGRGRFVAAIDATVTSLCADPSWLLPAHDRDAQVFKGGSPYVDLAVASNGYQMALAAWLLDGCLPAPTLALMRENVARRLTGPVLATIDGTAPKAVVAGHWWASCDHNWNAVCTAGSVGAILTSEPSPVIRAKAVVWAEGNMRVFLAGFARDGYCSEGVGYWNYGFGHFAALAENLRTQTGGAVDLFKDPAVRRIAAAPAQLEMAAGVFPAFADCQLDARPDARLLQQLHGLLDQQGLGGAAGGVLAEAPPLYQTLTDLALRRALPPREPTPEAALPLRSWFAESGVCVVRPARAGGLAAAWKGGHNAEHHNHNDVGSTVVEWQGRAVLADPGAMVYRAETFSSERYRLPVLSSFGHAVPVVAGRLQAAGAASRGRVLSTEFAAERDSMVMDLESAYPECGLRKLERSWTYQREADASLVIEDHFGFEQPAAFATALVGFGEWYLDGGGERNARLLIDGGKGAVLQVDVEFSARGSWEVRRLDNPGKPVAQRLGLALAAPARDGFVRMSIRPAPGGVPASATKLAVGSVPEMLGDVRREP